MLLIISLGVIAWLLCAILATGFDMAYSKARWPSLYNYRRDLSRSLAVTLIAGPIAVFVWFFASEFARYGWFILPRKDA